MDLLLSLFQCCVVFPHLSLTKPQLDLRYSHQIVNTWPALSIFVDHPSNNLLQIFWIAHWDPFNFSSYNFARQIQMGACLERRMQSNHLVYNASKRPNVSFMIVICLFNLFGGHIIRCANTSMSVLALSGQYSAQAEVAKFDIILQVKKDISRFQIPV